MFLHLCGSAGKILRVRKLCLNFVFAFVNFQLLRIWIESRFLFVFILLIF